MLNLHFFILILACKKRIINHKWIIARDVLAKSLTPKQIEVTGWYLRWIIWVKEILQIIKAWRAKLQSQERTLLDNLVIGLNRVDRVRLRVNLDLAKKKDHHNMETCKVNTLINQRGRIWYIRLSNPKKVKDQLPDKWDSEKKLAHLLKMIQDQF